VPALAEFFGTEPGLSAPVISRLSTAREAECKAFGERDPSSSRFVYVRAHGIQLRSPSSLHPAFTPRVQRPGSLSHSNVPK